MSQRCGYVAVLGVPNAGKSTLINQLVGTKVTIVSPKIQTTRNRILGLAIKGESQIIFMDTPGIFPMPKRRLEKAMVQAAWNALVDADSVALVVDVSKKKQTGSLDILEKIHEHGKRVTLILNKVDLVPKESLLEIAQLFQHPAIDEVFMVSALKDQGVDDVLTYFASQMPEGIWLFPEDQVSDFPQRLLAAEITREKVFTHLHEELPYSIMVDTEDWEQFKNGDLRIVQVIYVQRESQKGIVVGKGGQQIKKLGEQARHEMSDVFGQKVHLNLRVKVKENWMDRPQHYHMLGLDYNVQ